MGTMIAEEKAPVMTTSFVPPVITKEEKEKVKNEEHNNCNAFL